MAASTNVNPKFFKHILSIKLNNENFLLWKQQVMAVIRGHNLLQYLNSSGKPIRFLSQEDEIAGIVNSELSEWEQQDQLLVSWLLSSVTEGVLTRMVG